MPMSTRLDFYEGSLPSKFWEIVKDRDAWHAAVHEVAKMGHDRVTERQQLQTDTMLYGRSL